MESFFSGVFDKADPQLHQRWISLRNVLGLPHVITVAAVQQVMQFAEAELSALALLGGSAQNTGLPMTENQRNRLLQQKATEQRRLAAKAAKAAAGSVPATPQKPNPVAKRISATTSYWAPLCVHWVNKGRCS